MVEPASMAFMAWTIAVSIMRNSVVPQAEVAKVPIVLPSFSMA